MDNIVTLTNGFGQEEKFELLDVIEHNDEKYVVLLPVGATDGEVIILQYESADDETESYVSVEDADVLMAVFRIFRDKWKSEFDFADES